MQKSKLLRLTTLSVERHIARPQPERKLASLS
jgi:hypothetical protein